MPVYKLDTLKNISVPYYSITAHFIHWFYRYFPCGTSRMACWIPSASSWGPSLWSWGQLWDFPTLRFSGRRLLDCKRDVWCPQQRCWLQNCHCSTHWWREFPVWVRQNSPWGFSCGTAPQQAPTSEWQPGPTGCYSYHWCRLGDTAAVYKWKTLVVATSTFQTKTWTTNIQNIKDWFQPLSYSVDF